MCVSLKFRPFAICITWHNIWHITMHHGPAQLHPAQRFSKLRLLIVAGLNRVPLGSWHSAISYSLCVTKYHHFQGRCLRCPLELVHTACASVIANYAADKGYKKHVRFTNKDSYVATKADYYYYPGDMLPRGALFCVTEQPDLAYLTCHIYRPLYYSQTWQVHALVQQPSVRHFWHFCLLG